MESTEDRKIDFQSALLAQSRAVVICASTQFDQPIVFVNPAFTALTHYEPDEVLGRNPGFMEGDDTDPSTIADLRAAILAGESIRREILNYRKDGKAFWNDLTIDPVRDGAGAIVGFIGVMDDATARRNAEEEKVAVEQRLRDVTSHVPGYVYRRVLRPDGTIEFPYLSPSIYEMLGVPEGGPPLQLLSHVHPEDQERFKAGLAKSAADLSMFQDEFRLIGADGRIHWIRSRAPPRHFPNGDVVWDGLALDITAEKSAEAERAFLASYDPLTGLSNRTQFKTALSNAVNAMAQDGLVWIIVVDIDDFQEINEGLGHSAADEVLRIIGQRLNEFLEPGGAVARLGGDEFAVMILPQPLTGSITALAAAISRDIARPIAVGGRELIVQVCVGAAIYPSPEDQPRRAASDVAGELMKRADLALRAAKQQGPGVYRLYAADFDDRNRNRLALRQSLHRAIDEGQFVLHYHPLVELASGRIIGAEALVRWNHPELGLQRPDLFIPLAEASGLIVPLGAWIMRQAFQQQQTWRRQGLTPPRIAINVSSVQLNQSDFIAGLERGLADTGADPSGFELELTEGLLIEPSPEILSVLEWLKSVGFGITIDDFGTGHSTFKYLRDFPVDKIKIDQTFVRNLVIDSGDASIIRALIGLSRGLGIQIVAEGIETTMQLDFLRDEGCNIGQGYLFSVPLAAEDFAWLVQNRLTLPLGAEEAEVTIDQDR